MKKDCSSFLQLCCWISLVVWGGKARVSIPISFINPFGDLNWKRSKNCLKQKKIPRSQSQIVNSCPLIISYFWVFNLKTTQVSNAVKMRVAAPKKRDPFTTHDLMPKNEFIYQELRGGSIFIVKVVSVKCIFFLLRQERRYPIWVRPHEGSPWWRIVLNDDHFITIA